MKFSDRRVEDDELGINLTPLIDVVFLLLIFFMVSTTFSKESQLNIQLPEASAARTENQPNAVLIEISGDGAYAIKGPEDVDPKRLVDTETETLMRALKLAADTGDKDLVTVIRADKRTPHEAVVRAMDASRRLGLLKITFSTQKAAE